MHIPLRRILYPLAGVARILVVIALGLWISGYLFFGSLCGNEIVQKLTAPDGRHVAFLFQRDCGATTGFSSQVSLFHKDAANLPNDPGNIFIADLRGNGPAGHWHGPLVHLRWLNGKVLEIRYHHTATTYYREKRLGIVQIKYIVD